jgi:hypothetical protein
LRHLRRTDRPASIKYVNLPLLARGCRSSGEAAGGRRVYRDRLFHFPRHAFFEIVGHPNPSCHLFVPARSLTSNCNIAGPLAELPSTGRLNSLCCMKHLSTVILGLLCLGLAVSLFVSKGNNDAQHEKDAETITSTSNLLSSSQTEVAAFKGNAITLSNQLETCLSTSLTLSNDLIEAKSALATAKEGSEQRITDLNRQINRQSTQLETENQSIANLTRQVAELTNQIASARASLLQANKDYVLLDNRFRRDVAERVIVERKFNNLRELKAQIENLQFDPSQEISEDRIREGLDVVVRSNLCYVIAPE